MKKEKMIKQMKKWMQRWMIVQAKVLPLLQRPTRQLLCSVLLVCGIPSHIQARATSCHCVCDSVITPSSQQTIQQGIRQEQQKNDSTRKIVESLSISIAELATMQAEPWDSLGQFYTLTPNIARRAGVAEKFPAFREARLYALRDTTFGIHLMSWTLEGDVRDTLILRSAQEIQWLRVMIQNGLDSIADVDYAIFSSLLPDKNSRLGFEREASSLIVASTIPGALIGAGIYALTRPFIFGRSGNILVIDILAIIQELLTQELLTVNAFLGVGGQLTALPVFLATNNTPISAGTATLASGGLTNGLFHGLAFYDLIAGSGATGGARFLSLIAGSVAGGLSGYWLADAHRLSESRANLMTIFGFWGAGVGYSATYPLIDPNVPEAARWRGLGSLLGSACGYFLGDVVSKSQFVGSGDAQVVNAHVLAGLQAGSLLDQMIDPDLSRIGPRSNLIAPVLGACVGALIGLNNTKNADFTRAQGSIILTSTVLGSLILSSVGALLSSGSLQIAPSPAAIGALLGGLAGTIISMEILKNSAPREPIVAFSNRTTGASSTLLGNESVSSFASLNDERETTLPHWLDRVEMHISPLGALGFLAPATSAAAMFSPPLVNIRYTFE